MSVTRPPARTAVGVGGLLGGLDVSINRDKATPLAIGKPDGVLSVLPHSREDTWDRRASALGFWVWRVFGSSGLSGRGTHRMRACARGLNGDASAPTNAAVRHGVSWSKARRWQRLPEMEKLGDTLVKHFDGIAASVKTGKSTVRSGQ
jgi:hypothetical protein